MVGVSASVDLPLHHKVQKFSSGTGSPGWSQKKGRKTVVVCGGSVEWIFVHKLVHVCIYRAVASALTLHANISTRRSI